MTAPTGITVNGRPHPLEAPTPVAELLAVLGFASRPVVVELDGRALAPADHADTLVEPGATLEIVTLAAGG